MPINRDVYKPERGLDDALFRPEVRNAIHGLIAQRWTDVLLIDYPSGPAASTEADKSIRRLVQGCSRERLSFIGKAAGRPGMVLADALRPSLTALSAPF